MKRGINCLVFVKDNLASGQLTKIGSWDFSLSTKDSLKYSSTNTPSQYNFTITKQNVYDAYQNKKARPSGAFQKDMEDVVEYMKENFQLKDYQEGAILQEAENNIFVFIIDEINRAEISKVFGELFFSIDAGYRGEKGRVKTQYTNLQDDGDVFKEGFYIPENVYIIGTMNDIDRSVESFDFAMRRRFAWKEIKAIDRISMWDGSIDEWKDEALIRMKSLNSKIETIQGLGSAFHIGPAYFLKLKNYNGSYDQLWDNHLEGVLFEYLRGFPDSDLRLNELKSAYEVIIESQSNVENN
jgi:5-methylcytosine-specific restriction enzyme B